MEIFEKISRRSFVECQRESIRPFFLGQRTAATPVKHDNERQACTPECICSPHIVSGIFFTRARCGVCNVEWKLTWVCLFALLCQF